MKTSTNNLFIVSLEYKVPLEDVDKHLASHRAFMDKYFLNNTFIISGKKVPRTGGIIIASSKDKSTLEAILNDDPFKQNNIADYQITEFTPNVCNENMSKLAKKT